MNCSEGSDRGWLMDDCWVLSGFEDWVWVVILSFTFIIMDRLG